jgi:hypothetical protein
MESAEEPKKGIATACARVVPRGGMTGAGAADAVQQDAQALHLNFMNFERDDGSCPFASADAPFIE